MHWFENSLANINIEALNDILLWATGIIETYDLDYGSGKSLFESTFPIMGASPADFNFLHPITVLAILIVIITTMLKLWVTIMSPFGNAEEPGAIIFRASGATIGVVMATELFKWLEVGFNAVYHKFTAVYLAIVERYNISSFGGKLGTSSSSGSTVSSGLGESIKKALESVGKLKLDITVGSWWRVVSWLVPDGGTEAYKLGIFGGEKLINPKWYEDAGMTKEVPLGVLLLELIIGIALIVCFFRLLLEVYERYVLLGIMYITSPLAFAGIITKDATIFKNWLAMLFSQLILMCSNLMFLGGFVAAWYNIISRGLDPDRMYLYESPSEYFATMFFLIGWLIIGQKFDQHLKGIGLSTAQTGAGLAAALAGGVVGARALLGAAGAVGGGLHRAATGSTLTQAAYRSGTGLYGNLPGAGMGNKFQQRMLEQRQGGANDGRDKPKQLHVGESDKKNLTSLPPVPNSQGDNAQYAADLNSQNRFGQSVSSTLSQEQNAKNAKAISTATGVDAKSWGKQGISYAGSRMVGGQEVRTYTCDTTGVAGDFVNVDYNSESVTDNVANALNVNKNEVTYLNGVAATFYNKSEEL